MATSASLRTTNYQLHKYASNDEVKVLQDFNVNMDLIDAGIHTVTETLDVTAGEVSDSITRLDGLDDSVEALQTAVNTANNTANSALSASGTANAGVASIASDITVLEAKVESINIASAFTMGTNITSPTIKAVVKNNRVNLQIIAYANGTFPAGTLHNMASIAAGSKPSTMVNTTGCLQDGVYIYQGGLLVQITTAGTINISSNVPITNKYIQFTVSYDLD